MNMMKKTTAKKTLYNYYFIYFLTFILLSALAFSPFFMNNKSFISTGDGIQQHYNSLVYWGKYVRTIIKTLLFEHKLVIPTWDFSLGMGADIYTTLHYYAIGDPLNLFYIITPAAYSEALYNLLFFVRLFLAGLSFSIYIRRFNKHIFPVLCGTVIYIFCSYVFVVPVIHPYFLNPMIYLPLLFLGIEKIFSGESPKCFIIMVFISALSNFYFLYMLSVFIFIYACIRFFSFFHEHRIQNIILQLRNFIGYYLTGICMSGILLFPVIMTTLGTGRMKDKPAVDLIYRTTYYEKLFAAFLSSDAPGYYTLMGFGCIPLLLIFFLFLKRKKYTQLKISLLILGIFVTFPVFGSALNGFSYVTNRWIFALSFLIAAITALVIEKLHDITTKESLILLALSFVYILIMLHTKASDNGKITAVLLLLSALFLTAGSKIKTIQKFFRPFVLFMLCCNVLINAYYLYSPEQKAYTDLFINLHGGLASMKQSSGASVPGNTDTFYRYGDTNNQQSIMYNGSAISGKYSTSGYYSLISDSVTGYSKEILSSTERAETKYAGFDERAIPQTLASTKYFVVQRGKEQYLPFGFSQKAGSYKAKNPNGKTYNRTFDSYLNDYFLPFGYTYDTYITEAQWKQYDFLKKEEAMLQTCYIDSKEKLSVPQNTEVRFYNKELPYTFRSFSGVQYKDGKFIVEKPNASLTVEFDGLAKCETYLAFQNLQFSLPEGSKQTMPADALITVHMNKRYKKVRLYTPKHTWYNGIHDFAVNLGYESETPSSLTLTFPRAGVYSYDKLSLYGLPLGENYTQAIHSLKEETMQNVQILNDRITGDIEVSSDKILCLSIPYGKGWRGYIDGKEVPLFQTNIMYTGLEISPGYHTIRLEYSSPYLKTGIFISTLGILSFLILILYEKRLKSGNR